MAAPRTKPPLLLTPEDRAWLERLRRSQTPPRRHVERAETLIRYADGQSTWAIRRQTGFFRGRFTGVSRSPRPRGPPRRLRTSHARAGPGS